MNDTIFDKKFIQIINVLADMVVLSLLWTVCALPVVTIGAASAALYHTMELSLAQDKGRAVPVFFRSLRQSWRYGLLFGAAAMLCTGLIAYTGYLSYFFEEGVLLLPYLMCVFIALLLLAAQIYLYPLIGHFTLNTRQLVIMTVQLVLLHPLKSLLLVVILLAAVEAAVNYPPLLMIIPAGYTWLAAKICTPLFFRYIRMKPSEGAESDKEHLEFEEV